MRCTRLCPITALLITVLLITVLLIEVAAASARGDFLTERWGNTPRCSHRGTLSEKDGVLKFDLSALPPGTKIFRAVLNPGITRRQSYEAAIRICPVLQEAAGAGQQPKLGNPLALRPPRYRIFDATLAVRRWVAEPRKNLGLYAQWPQGVQSGEVTLEVSYQGEVAEAIPNVTHLSTLSRHGQTFLTFKEIEDVVGRDEAVFGEFEQRVLESEKRRRITYRVYRHTEPITVEMLGQADRIDEVRAVLSAYNLQMIRVIEHANREKGHYPSTLIEGGNRDRSQKVTHLIVSDGGRALTHGTGLSVVQQPTAGRFYYAVTAAIDGREAVRRLDAGCSTPEPVEHRPGGIAPVLQKVKPFLRHNKPAGELHDYSLWLREPYSPFPRAVWMQVAVYDPQKEQKEYGQPPEATAAKRSLEVTTPFYGEVVVTTSRHYVPGSIQLGVPNFSDPMWQGMHEAHGTLKSYEQGIVQNYQQRVALALVEWAKRKYPVDPERVYLWGQFGYWAIRHGDVFAAVMADGYGNYSEMIEAQKRWWQWGPGELGGRNWLGIPQWVYMQHNKWVWENPSVQMPYVFIWPAPGSHVGDMGFLSWPETLRALADTKRAFSATWGHSLGTPPPPTLELITQIRRGRAVPAFTNCTIDDNPGDGRHGEDGDYRGRMNAFLMWEPQSVIDSPDRFEITVYLHPSAPEDACRADLTPRRTQRFRAKPGEQFTWTATALGDGRQLASGTATADPQGLVTAEKVIIAKGKNRLVIRRVN